jgi:hypothetical protein
VGECEGEREGGRMDKKEGRMKEWMKEGKEGS